METLLGRISEKEELLRCYNSERSEFVMIYGRRRIGKTFLVNKVLGQKFTFQFTGSHKAGKSRQLERFADALKEQFKLSYTPFVDSWYHAFDALESLISQKKGKCKKVAFFDEMPWIDTPGSEFVSAFEDFWNTWAMLRDDIMCVACGSATSWMVDNLVENQGGLHGRITSRIYLRPFTLAETEQYLRSHACQWSRYTITQCYMFIGGIPYYLSLLDPQKELAANIDDLFFLSHAKLENEFHELYSVLFRDSERYMEIVRLLAAKREGMTRAELVEATKSNGGSLSKRLENLERCDFILSTQQFGNKRKGMIYRLSDFFTLFYLRFVDGKRRSSRPYWTTMSDSPAVAAWQGLTFELVSMMHVDPILKKLGISGVHTDIYSWRGIKEIAPEKGGNKPTTEKAQVDLVIERSDKYIYLCEMKFSSEEYVITKDYEQRLRSRMSLFRECTKTRKALLNTFVTTYGVKTGMHSGIVNHQVLLDDLFDNF